MQVLKSIETVCGPVPFEQLGWTLAHEHFFTVTYDSPGMYLSDPQIRQFLGNNLGPPYPQIHSKFSFLGNFVEKG